MNRTARLGAVALCLSASLAVAEDVGAQPYPIVEVPFSKAFPAASGKSIEIPGMANWPSSFIYDQGNLGSVVSNAVAYVVKYFSVRQYGVDGHLDPSRLYLYWNARHFEHTVMPTSGIDTNIDSGNSVFGSLLSLKETGCAPESVNWYIGTVKSYDLEGAYIYYGWRYADNSSQYKKQPDPMSYTIALTEDITFDSVGKGQLGLGAQRRLRDQSLPKVNPFPSLCKKIKSFDIASPYRKTSWKTPNTVAEKSEVRTKIVNALAKGHPVLTGMDIDNSFDKASSTGIVPMPNLSTFYPIGGHAVVIVGYGPYVPSTPQTMYFKAINSWGASWGAKGYLYLPDEYVTNVNIFQEEIFEMWHPAIPN
jgi:hypothetical protein